MSSSQKRAKLLLVGKGVARENSDDELGTDEELTWEWIDSGSGCNITGARFGNFVCRLGDCVLLKAEIAKEAWVGIICEFKMGETDEKLANFMWFSTEREIRNKNRKRRDAMEVGPSISLRISSRLLISRSERAVYYSFIRLESSYYNQRQC